MKLPQDVKKTALAIIQGYDARKLRYRHTQLKFDQIAMQAVEQALTSVATDVESEEVCSLLRRKVLDSAQYGIRYEYIGEVYCGRDKFYSYRRKLIERVACNMGMI